MGIRNEKVQAIVTCYDTKHDLCEVLTQDGRLRWFHYHEPIKVNTELIVNIMTDGTFDLVSEVVELL